MLEKTMELAKKIEQIFLSYHDQLMIGELDDYIFPSIDIANRGFFYTKYSMRGFVKEVIEWWYMKNKWPEPNEQLLLEMSDKIHEVVSKDYLDT